MTGGQRGSNIDHHLHSRQLQQSTLQRRSSYLTRDRRQIVSLPLRLSSLFESRSISPDFFILLETTRNTSIRLWNFLCLSFANDFEDAREDESFTSSIVKTENASCISFVNVRQLLAISKSSCSAGESGFWPAGPPREVLDTCKLVRRLKASDADCSCMSSTKRPDADRYSSPAIENTLQPRSINCATLPARLRAAIGSIALRCNCSCLNEDQVARDRKLETKTTISSYKTVLRLSAWWLHRQS